MNKARDILVDVLADLAALSLFQETQVLQRGVYDARVPAPVRARLERWRYVTVQPYRVFLTEIGLEVAEYRQVA